MALTGVATVASRRRGRLAAAALAGLVLVSVIQPRAAPGSPPGGPWLQKAIDPRPGAAERLRRLAGHGPVLVLDTDLFPHFPDLLVADLTTTSRYACQWPLPAAIGDAAVARQLRDALVEDCAKRPPRLIVARRPPIPHLDDAELDAVEWLSRDPRLAALLAGYRHAGDDGRFDYYVVR